MGYKDFPSDQLIHWLACFQVCNNCHKHGLTFLIACFPYIARWTITKMHSFMPQWPPGVPGTMSRTLLLQKYYQERGHNLHPFQVRQGEGMVDKLVPSEGKMDMLTNTSQRSVHHRGLYATVEQVWWGDTGHTLICWEMWNAFEQDVRGK